MAAAPGLRIAYADVPLGAPAAALKARLEARPGASAEPYYAPRGTSPLSAGYKVLGKTFAILFLREPLVMLKCDPHLAEILRDQYAGIGHRTHLDPRHWIAVTLGADVPDDEIARLADGSYDLVCAGLTKKEQAQLAALS
jgi:predicted DNA-binding protein (MmcQ/YjbR family)